MKKRDYIELLRQVHEKLEAVTDRVGCDFETAKLLCDVNGVLKGEKADKAPSVAAAGLSLVH